MLNITVAIIDDHTLLLDGIRDIVASHPAVNKVEVFNTANTFLEEYAPEKFQLIVTDIDMPGKTGTELVAEVKNKQPKQAIMVLSMHKSKDLLTNLFQLGINGFVGKDAKPAIFHNAIDAILRGEVFLPADVKKLMEDKSEKNEILLTKREIEIIQLITRGKSTQEMANQLFISEATVKTHRQNIRLKLGISNPAELVRYAFEHKIC